MKTSTMYAVQNEVDRARKKYPTCYLAALVEEVGEVAKAMMQEGSASERAREELVQVAATAIRLIEEPDPLHIEPVEDCVEEPPTPGSKFLDHVRECATVSAMAALAAHAAGPHPSWEKCPANQFEGGCPQRSGRGSCNCE